MSRHEKTTDGERAPTTLAGRAPLTIRPASTDEPAAWVCAGSVTRPGGYATESAVYDWVKQAVDFAGGTTHWLKVSAGGGADPVGIHADDLVFPLPVKPPSQGDVWTEERRVSEGGIDDG